jgi:hypothetical protein
MLKTIQEYINNQPLKGIHYTILSHQETVETVLSSLGDQLSRVQKMKNAFKKKECNNRLYAAKVMIEELYSEKLQTSLNSVILINEQVRLFPIPKKKVAHLQAYNVRPFSFYHGDTFDIDFLRGTIANMKFDNICRLDKDLLVHMESNPWKWRLIKEQKVSDKDLDIVLHAINREGLIYGTSPHLKKMKESRLSWVCVPRRLDRQEAHELLEAECMKKIHQELDEALSIVDNEKEMHKAIFGSLNEEYTGMETSQPGEPLTLVQAIEEFRVERLYCHEKMFSALHEKYTNEHLNFKIIKMKTIEEGDSGDRLLSEYNGFFGVAYY